MSHMKFDPIRDIEQSQLILIDGEWPSFHDAQVHFINFWKGKIEPENNIWIGEILEIDFEHCALELPFFSKLCFFDCSEIKLNTSDNVENMIDEIKFDIEERGFFTNGEPLPPNIIVSLLGSIGLHLSFKCMKVKVLERYENIRERDITRSRKDADGYAAA